MNKMYLIYEMKNWYTLILLLLFSCKPKINYESAINVCECVIMKMSTFEESANETRSSYVDSLDFNIGGELSFPVYKKIGANAGSDFQYSVSEMIESTTNSLSKNVFSNTNKIQDFEMIRRTSCALLETYCSLKDTQNYIATIIEFERKVSELDRRELVKEAIKPKINTPQSVLRITKNRAVNSITIDDQILPTIHSDSYYEEYLLDHGIYSIVIEYYDGTTRRAKMDFKEDKMIRHDQL